MNSIINGNADNMKEIADESIDCIVTSPPYFNLKQYAQWNTYDEHLAFVEYVLAECHRVLIPGGWICWNIQECLPISKEDRQDKNEREGTIPLLADTIKAMQNADFMYEKDVIWYKGKGTATQKLFGTYPYPGLLLISGLTEHIIFARKARGKFRKERSEEVKEKSKLTKEEWGSWATDLWEIQPARAKSIGHEAPYPVELAYRCIRMNSFYGDVILDPFMGSGSTAIAAIRCGREYVGYEIHKDTIEIANMRIRESKDIFGCPEDWS